MDDETEGQPRWWRDVSAEFDAHDMPAYRPPRFSDGAIVPTVVQRLEDDLAVSIRLRSINPQRDGEWEIVVDGEPVDSVGRRRESEGYSLYELSAGAFESIVREVVEDA